MTTESTFISKGKMNFNIKALIIPVFFFLLFIILFIFSSKIAYSKISSQLSAIKDIGEKNSAIGAKIEELKNIRIESFPDSDVILTSFPEDDPSLWMLTQIRRKSEEDSLLVVNQKISFSNQATDVISSDIYFDLVGDTPNIIQFLLDMDKVAPISTLTSVVFNLKGVGTAGAGALVDMRVYHSKIPTQLSQINAPVNKLTDEENQTLLKLSKMEPPEFTKLSPNSPFEVTNPF
jgi:hypothetical protein